MQTKSAAFAGSLIPSVNLLTGHAHGYIKIALIESRACMIPLTLLIRPVRPIGLILGL